ncbi:MAG: hypothetical protein JW874_05685 [Spirochaetales bacterium]|nr:hypothetical protein [Spirochaetales bacterium]
MTERKKIRLIQIKLPYGHSRAELEKAVLKILHADIKDIISFSIYRRSLDTRKNSLSAVYTIDVELENAGRYMKLIGKSPNISELSEVSYIFPAVKSRPAVRPFVAGAGPAGLFCALVLAENGYRPVVFERGQNTEERIRTVNRFWETSELDPDSNIQFGEGGAGAFSDGKLNTGVKDKSGRFRKVLKHLADFGAPLDILIDSRPHIGTDFLKTAVINMRRYIESLGGEFRFASCLTDLITENSGLRAVEINRRETIDCCCLVLATGHSARDTYEVLKKHGVRMEPKIFAVGIRIEHPQDLINRSQYKKACGIPGLPPAEYRLSDKTADGRGVYTFCMCPGGYVVNASSEPGGLVINGMSYYKRDSANANSAVLVNVYPEDFASADPLAGIEFQRELERKAYLLGGSSYAVPVQRFQDYLDRKPGREFGSVEPCIKGRTAFADLNRIFPDYINRGIREGIVSFGRKIKGFDDGDALLSAVESRSSSPVSVTRGEDFQSAVGGVFPCGAGAGYAGGIMSAAIDGIKTAEAAALYLSVV